MDFREALIEVLNLIDDAVEDRSPEETEAIEIVDAEIERLESEADGFVKAAGGWRTNGELIADVARLYLRPTDRVVDVTYGKGTFWQEIRHQRFVAHDLDRAKGDGVDFRSLPETNGSVDVLVLDPNYVAKGGRSTSTIDDMDALYAMDTTAKNPAENWRIMRAGIVEAHRVLRPGGLLWFKLMNYITGGTYQNVLGDAFAAFEAIGFELVDMFDMVGGTGPQPLTMPCPACKHLRSKDCPRCDGAGTIPRGQKHARNNVSYLLVARKVAAPAEQTALDITTG